MAGMGIRVRRQIACAECHWIVAALIGSACLLAGCAASPTPVATAPVSVEPEPPPQIIIVNFGEAHYNDLPGEVSLPTTTTGKFSYIDEESFGWVNERSFEIPSRIGSQMAVEYFVLGGSSAPSATIEMRTIHPAITNPETGRTTTVSRWYSDVPKNARATRSYTLEYDWEVVPGEWTFEFWYDGEFVTQQVFNVVPATD